MVAACMSVSVTNGFLNPATSVIDPQKNWPAALPRIAESEPTRERNESDASCDKRQGDSAHRACDKVPRRGR